MKKNKRQTLSQMAHVGSNILNPAKLLHIQFDRKYDLNSNKPIPSPHLQHKHCKQLQPKVTNRLHNIASK